MNLLKLLFGSKKAAPAEPTEKKKQAFVTEADVRAHCIGSSYVEFMCKNCGRTFNSLYVRRTDGNYCHACSCWICDNCAGEPCAECNDKQKSIQQ